MYQKHLILAECVGDELPYDAIEEWEQEEPTAPLAPATMWTLVKGPPRSPKVLENLLKNYLSDRRCP